jgi:hypothetical protein
VGRGVGVVGPTIKEDTMSETERERRRFYRVKEAAAIMGVPPRTVYHLAETVRSRAGGSAR